MMIRCKLIKVEFWLLLTGVGLRTITHRREAWDKMEDDIKNKYVLKIIIYGYILLLQQYLKCGKKKYSLYDDILEINTTNSLLLLF